MIWSPYFKMGMLPGRTMVRAYGTHIDSLDDSQPEARAGLEKCTPEIFETDTWTDFRLDNLDFMNEVREKIASGEFQTPFMKPDDTVRIEMMDADGKSIFGAIEQTVKAIQLKGG